jgi:hypothetical protein
MPPSTDLPSAGLGVATGVGLIALFLGLRLWYERRGREPALPAADRVHFTHQDLRRGLGVGILVVVAAALGLGSRIPPRIAGKANLLFAVVWLVVLGLIVVLLLLAMIDWMATRRYAMRHRKAMIREQISAMKEHARHAAASRTSAAEGPREPTVPPPPP